MNENKKEEIRKEAKRILDNFSKALEKVSVKKKVLKKEVGGFRDEGNGKETDMDFRKRIFENFRIKDSDSARESDDSRHAPNKDGDYLIAEKKKW